MSDQPPSEAVSRRRFLKVAGASIGSLAGGAATAGPRPSFSSSVALVVSQSDALARAAPPTWALGQLSAALEHAGLTIRRVGRLEDTERGELCVVTGATQSGSIEAILRKWGIAAPIEPESLCLAQARVAGRRVILAAGPDAVGLTYALTELAERIGHGELPAALRSLPRPVVERPFSRTRSVMRAFCSEIEDKRWFYDHAYWLDYLSLLAACRFNRLSFTTGMGYNYAAAVTDGYFVFPYPFLVHVPGYTVRAAGLTDAERQSNLDMLRFIGTEAARRGLRFQLGLWTLAYRWPDSPQATYRVEGLDEESFPTYCRDALAQVLREVPEITGITFRVHEESGIDPSRDDFWRAQFEAIARCGRRIEIDLHAKNMPPRTLALAIATGQPTVVSPKYCGEHMGLGYHPASIREAEMHGADQLVDSGSGLLAGDRTFTRYGYADYLAHDRDWDVVFRIWPGTQRFLLSGDPALFAAFARSAPFCGAAGIEWTEPLFFKGRLGSGQPGGRCGYADHALSPARDFDKYRYTYRLWGRLAYNPAADPEVWRRGLRREFGQGAADIETALAAASRILPLITLAHAEAADCQVYWPDIYTNVPIADSGSAQPEEIRVGGPFGEVSAFDPQLFQSPIACAGDLLRGRIGPRYTPLEVAQWLESLASQIDSALAAAQSHLQHRIAEVGFRRVQEDVLIQRGIAVFFAAKLRSAVLWAVHAGTGSPAAAAAAISRYRAGRDAWEQMARRAARIYRTNLTYGSGPLAGHWLDRTEAFDRDIEAMVERSRSTATVSTRTSPAVIDSAIRSSLATPPRPTVCAHHTPVRRIPDGTDLLITLDLTHPSPARVTLQYRHVNQAERWQSKPLSPIGAALGAQVPAAYAARRFALQYYFEIEDSGGRVALFPGLGPQLAGVPYYVVERG